MKRITAIAILTIAGFFAAGNALAQQNEVRANVPFSFTAGGKILPPGSYSISSVGDNVIWIHTQRQRVAMLALAFDTTDQSKSGSVLVFEKHGDLYSLRKILCGPQSMNVSLPAEHWKCGSYLEEAMNSPADSQVLIPVGN
jgi:hypothetical protein